MRYLTMICLLTSALSVVRAQTGLSVGTHGFGIKTTPAAAWRLTVRSGAVGIGVDQRISQLTAQPEFIVNRTWLRTSQVCPYIGLGVQSRLFWQSGSFSSHASLLAPVGIEIFPFKSERISLTTEARFVWPLSSEAPRPALGGLIELTWYLR